MEYSIRSIKSYELENTYKCIKQDFPPGEYAPYDILYQQLETGVQRGFLLIQGEREVAYCICAEGNTYAYVLISLFAVYKEFRGNRFGSAFLEELKRIYSDKKGIIVEVEKPEDSKNYKEKAIRIKRIEFYQKAGFYLVPSIDYSIWNVPMHLMVLPQKASAQIINAEIGQAIYEIYYKLMGERYIHKMKFRALE